MALAGPLALVGSGLFSILLVLSRTPYVNQWLPAANFFQVSLVLHVDLSVLVWFVAQGGMLWSIHGTRRGTHWGWLALAVAAVGTLAMALAPFLNRGDPVMANYIPVLIAAVSGRPGRVRAGTALLVLRSLLAAPRLGLEYDGRGALDFGLSSAAIATAVGLLAFAWSLCRAADRAAWQGLLRNPVLGRWPRLAVHLDPAHAGGLALAGQRLWCACL